MLKEMQLGRVGSGKAEPWMNRGCHETSGEIQVLERGRGSH